MVTPLINRESLLKSEELQFVLNCINNKSVFDNTTHLNLDKVVMYAVEHRLFPIVFNVLHHRNDVQNIGSIMKIFQTACFYNAYNITQITNETIRIADKMDNNGIETIFLKGPPLSVRLGEDTALRVSRDIDLLVDINKFDMAEVVLEQLGYRLLVPDFTLTKSQRKFYLRNDHHFEYYHPKIDIVVELHWRIRSYNIKHYSVISNINTQTIDFFDTKIKVMEDEHWLIYLMIHGYKHLWSRLRWLYDIKKFIKDGCDWDKAIAIANKAEVSTIMRQTMILLNILLEVPYPDKLRKTIENDRKAWLLAERVLIELNRDMSLPDNSLGRINNIDYFNFNDRWLDKVYALVALLKPNEREFKQVTFPDYLFSLYYLQKAINYIRKYLSNK